MVMDPVGDAGGAGPDDDTEFVGGRRSPLRRCVATGAIQTKDLMIRFVAAPDGQLVPDLEGSLPGRGLWASADKAVLARAVAKNSFAKAARRAVRVAPDLPERLDGLLADRCLNLLGLACRAGQSVAGFEKVREALKSGKISRAGRAAILLAASDGAADGRGKLRALAQALPVVDLFTAAELGAALGRDNAVHAAVAQGGLADRFLAECRRLAGVRGATVSAVGQSNENAENVMVGRAPTSQPD